LPGTDLGDALLVGHDLQVVCDLRSGIEAGLCLSDLTGMTRVSPKMRVSPLGSNGAKSAKSGGG